MTSHRRTKFAAALREDLAEDLRLLARASRLEVAQVLEAILEPSLEANRAIIESERGAKPKAIAIVGAAPFLLDAPVPAAKAPKASRPKAEKPVKADAPVAEKPVGFDERFAALLKNSGGKAIGKAITDAGYKPASGPAVRQWQQNGVPPERLTQLLLLFPELGEPQA